MKELWRLMRFVGPYWWGSLLSVALIRVLNSSRLAPAWFIKLIIDQEERQARIDGLAAGPVTA